MTAPWENRQYEPMTPVDSENQLRWVLRAMYDAQHELREQRDAEVSAKHEFERAHRAALLSAECPKVTRGGHTTAERDAWVNKQCAAEREHYELAEVTRKAAEDRVRTLNAQSMVIAALAKQVNLAYAVAGDR